MLNVQMPEGKADGASSDYCGQYSCYNPDAAVLATQLGVSRLQGGVVGILPQRLNLWKEPKKPSREFAEIVEGF